MWDVRFLECGPKLIQSKYNKHLPTSVLVSEESMIWMLVELVWNAENREKIETWLRWNSTCSIGF